MKKLLVFVVFLLSLSLVSAATYDLSNYPGGFARSGAVTGIIVVGDSAPATHVIAQTQLALTLTAEAGVQQQGITKLASEVDNLQQNIISLGNACDNEVSAQILGNPSDCTEGYEAGEASISVHVNGNNVHLVVAGYSDRGTVDAANVLKNYDVFDLSGKTHTLKVNDPEGFVREDVQKESVPEPEPVKEEVVVEEPTPEAEPTPVAVEEAVEEAPGETQETEPEFVRVEETQNPIAKLFSWLFSIFK